MLRKNESLTSLDLAYNDIGPIGATCFADTFPENVTLTELNLSSNRIGPAGGHALAEGLIKNCGRLVVLKVSDNRLGDAAATHLASCMRGTTSKGLKSFACHSLNGPFCVSGRLQEKARERKDAATERIKRKVAKEAAVAAEEEEARKAAEEALANNERKHGGDLYGQPPRPVQMKAPSGVRMQVL